MSYEVFIGDKQGVSDRLNGALLLGPYYSSGLPVGGLTLVFTTPAAVVTFGGTLGSMRTLQQIIDDINTQAPTVLTQRRSANIAPMNVTDPSAHLALQLDTGIVIDSAGTANELLKLSTTEDTVGSAAVAAAKVIGFSVGLTTGHYALIIDLS